MNKFRELAIAATAFASNLGYNKAWVWEDALAEYVYQDIMSIIADRAVLGESAADAYKHLKSIFEGYTEPSTQPAKDITDDDVSL